MGRLQTPPLLLLLLIAGWKVKGSSLDEGKVLTTLRIPASSLSTISHGDTPQLVPERLAGSREEEEEDYAEEYEELSGSEEFQDGMSPPKVQAVVKPQNEDQKKKGSKNLKGKKGKRKKNKNGKRKKRDPCKTTFKDYCIHGKCQYLKDLNKPSCVCLPGYQNERCGIQALHTGTKEKEFTGLSITLMVVGVSLVIFTLTAVTVALILHMRKKMRVEGETENEDKQKLRAENGIVV